MEGEALADSDGATFLETLNQANLFITPLDDKHCWYRYHPLFADLLRGRLAQTLPLEVSILHIRASAWFEQNGLTNEAVGHALAGEDYERAARLLEGAARDVLFNRFEPQVLLGWLAALPADFVATRPALGLAQAWGLVMTGQRKAAQARLDGVEFCCTALPNEVGKVSGVKWPPCGPRSPSRRPMRHASSSRPTLPWRHCMRMTW